MSEKDANKNRPSGTVNRLTQLAKLAQLPWYGAALIVFILDLIRTAAPAGKHPAQILNPKPLHALIIDMCLSPKTKMKNLV